MTLFLLQVNIRRDDYAGIRMGKIMRFLRQFGSLDGMYGVVYYVSRLRQKYKAKMAKIQKIWNTLYFIKVSLGIIGNIWVYN